MTRHFVGFICLILLAAPSAAVAAELSFGSEAEVIETFICNDEAVNEELATELELNLLATAACSKKKGTVFGVSFYYCSGTCSKGKSCQATLNTDGSIKRCSCKPTPASVSVTEPASGQ